MSKAKQAEPRPIRNPFYQRIQRAGGLTLRQGRGRPRKGADQRQARGLERRRGGQGCFTGSVESVSATSIFAGAAVGGRQ